MATGRREVKKVNDVSGSEGFNSLVPAFAGRRSGGCSGGGADQSNKKKDRA